MISFDNVSKHYGKKRVLDHLSFSMQGREFVTIVGPSGAGKSTLIHALIGATEIDEGSIIIDGYEISRMKPSALQYYRRKIGVVFQDYKLLQQKTVYENIAFAMEVCGAGEERIHARVPEVLNITSLLDKQHQFPVHLSGGEKQRLAIARALVHKPKLIIADEPTGNLDPRSAKEIILLLLALNHAGATILLTTHNKSLVDFINRRVIFLNQGKIISDVEEGMYDLALLEASLSMNEGDKIEITEIHFE